MADSWLFANGASSVRLVRTGLLTLSVFGPGRGSRRYTFQREPDFAQALGLAPTLLTNDGYQLLGYGADRRASRDATGR